MAETQSAPSLRELSEAATQGELNYPNWGTDFRAGTVLVGMTSPAFEGNGRANRAFLCRLWNDYRDGRLIDPTTQSEAVASARAEGWQPIETAPRDGKPIIAWGAEWGGPQVVGADGEWWNLPGSMRPKFVPTHWMPLPAPPTTPGGRTDG